MKNDFRILNWNVGGAKYLELEEYERNIFRQDLNYELVQLLRKYNPDVVTLQEIIRYGDSNEEPQEILDQIHGYSYYPFTLIDTYDMSATEKWRKSIDKGKWKKESYFAQGNGFLFNDKFPTFPVWSLSDGRHYRKDRHYVEKVTLQLGLYFGNRDTEPRAALVSHFILRPDVTKEEDLDKMILDVFVINLHLTTLKGEREGIPKKDGEGSKIRLNQLEAILHGIVSQYNTWRQAKYQRYEMKSEEKDYDEDEGITINRYSPLWILAGDFNFTPESVEYETIIRSNFIDCHKDHRGTGTKAKGMGVEATLTVDYIFAGPKFVSLDPLITEHAIKRNPGPDYMVRISDHYPLFAHIPLPISIKPYR